MHPLALHQARIFVVDDEPANLRLLDRMLVSNGYARPLLIQDPCQVLGHYRQARPDLIMLDLCMPGLDGYGVLEQLKSLADPLAPPVLVLTARDGRTELLKALDSGARDFVTKPFDQAELLVRVRNLIEVQLGQRLLHDQKTSLEQMVRERTLELRQSRLEVIQRLGRAAEHRDIDTSQHVLRMSHTSALLARSLGWSEADCELMLHASPMHDIGKIGISDAILLKPGELEPHEREAMKRHVEIGARILDEAHTDLMRLAHQIALTHHEKWDGSGYPAGLAGHAIPQAGRIVAVADVFDALTSARPYKPAWTVEAASAFLVERAGTHFDPEVIEHFMALLPQVVEIRERYADEPDSSF